ncbi:MAG: hypothetical protein C0618_09160 [Desulfuromonas sp.]|nr:MAG: hypothetical protein C0618_09160 [Desulfuromonas sp.]
MAEKTLTIAFYQREQERVDWQYRFPTAELEAFLQQMTEELSGFGVTLVSRKEETVITVKGYGDVLNSVRLRFPSAGLGNLCLGHVIGSSPNADLLEDLRRGINRVVFAPETVEPDGSDKVVCHNCGCGC